MISAKGENNENIDWWFIYKLPEKVGSPANQGFQYLFYGDGSAGLRLSTNLIEQSGALYNTLDGIFKNSDAGHGYIVYNDERTDGGENNSDKGHCKGVLAFNKTENTGLILLHSTPRFPKKGQYALPVDEAKFGQAYLCITLPDFATADNLAKQMLQEQDPQVLTINSQLPGNLDTTDSLYYLYHMEGLNEQQAPSTVNFKSRNGKQFSMVAKSKKWGEDFWVQLISVQLGLDMVVESWIRGMEAKSKDPGVSEQDKDVVKIDLAAIGYAGYNWDETQDHAKWGLGTPKAGTGTQGSWVCVADINRMTSQSKRGGGGICFQEAALWKALDSIVAQAKTN